MNPNDISIREAAPADINFIFDSYKCSVKNDSKLGVLCRASIFNKEFPKVIDQVLAKAKVIVACVDKEPSVILGYLIYEEDIVHFIFVKKAFWRLRIACMLMSYAFGFEEKPLECSVMTKLGLEIVKSKKLKIDHNPFLLFERSI